MAKTNGTKITEAPEVNISFVEDIKNICLPLWRLAGPSHYLTTAELEKKLNKEN